MRALSKIFASRGLAITVAITVLSITVACGGSSEQPPTPISKRFDDMHIAAIPLEQKQDVVKTQNDWSVAKMENAKAEADLNEMNAQLQGVRNDQKASRLAIDTAIANKKSAEASSDTNRINSAQKELRSAELLAKAADARVKYFEAYRAYLKRHHIYTQHNMYWREAQFELAKSQLAQKNSIAPKGVSFDVYASQEVDRKNRTSAAMQKAETEKSRATSARENWLKAQQVADEANGRPTQLPDPMAPKGVQATTGTTP